MNSIFYKNLFIFDFDGTIIDSSSMHHKIFNYLLKKKFNIQISSKDIEGKKTADVFRKQLPELSNYEIEELTLEKQTLYHKHRNEVTLIEGVKELLCILKNSDKKLCIASCASKENINYFLKKFNLRNFFSLILSSEDVLCSKPDPEIFIKAVVMCNFKKSESIIFEDSLNGINAALNAKIDVVCVNKNLFNTFDELKNVRCTEYKDLVQNF